MATTHDLKLRALLDVSQVKQQVQQLNSKNTVNLDASGISHSINLLNQTISKFTNSLEKLSQHTQQAAVKINNASNQSFTLGRLGEIGKVVAGIAVERAGGSAKNYFEATGNVAAANTSDFLSKFGRGALAGSAGGWIGAAIGGGFGALEFTFEQLADNAKKAAEELAAYQQVIAEARARDEAWSKYRGNRELKNLVETGTTEDVQKERDRRQRQRDYAYSGIKTFEQAYGESEPGKGDFEERAQKYIADLKEQLKNAPVKAKDVIGMSSEEVSKLPGRNKELEAAIKEVEEQLKIYQEDKKTIIEHDNVIQTLDSALKQRTQAEQQAAKAAEAKAEIERKATEAEQKRIEIEAQRNEAIIKKLRQTDTEGAESDEISDMLNGGNLQMLHKMLTSIQAKAEWAQAEYNKYLEAGEGDKATEARRQWMRYRGYESSITSGIEGLESKDISELGDQYNRLLNQLQTQLQPATPVAQLQAMGGNMGWVDRSTESIDNNVQKIVMQLQSILTQIRKTDISQPFILG